MKYGRSCERDAEAKGENFKAHLELMRAVLVKPSELLGLLQAVPDGNAHEAWTRLHRHFDRMIQEPEESVAAYAV